MAALHHLEVNAAEVLNAYVMVHNREKLWIVLGIEFWDVAGKSANTVKALFELKFTGEFFRAHLAQCMQELGYESCKADLDLW